MCIQLLYNLIKFYFVILIFSNGREARNRAEKNRRDKLSNSVHILSQMIPEVRDSPRRVDKTAVLRFAAHGIRLDYSEYTHRANIHRLIVYYSYVFGAAQVIGL